MPNEHSTLFRYTCRFIKYFSLFTVGITVALLFFLIFGASSFAVAIFEAIKFVWLRLAASSLMSLSCAIFFEAIQ